jgi:predicted dehydrogenase
VTLSRLPDARLFAPRSGEPSLRWGVVGPGWIAGEFVRAARAHTAQRVVAVASRSVERGAAFASAHGVEKVFTTVDRLVSDPDVDVVYIATPQSEHLDGALAAIAAGKHVLVEKPMAMTATGARTIADAARAAGVLAMEAMWARYLPQASVLRTLLADGALGEVRTVLADHGQLIDAGPEHRLYRPELGGGALLDLGIYTVQLALQVLGTPTSVTAVGGMTATGVDAYSTTVLGYPGEAQATLFTTIRARTPTTAAISGTDAVLTFPGPMPFYTPTSFTLSQPGHGGEQVTWTDPTGLQLFDGLSWEATALATFVGQGRTESPLHTLDETIAVLAVIDEAKAQVAAAHEPVGVR